MHRQHFLAGRIALRALAAGVLAVRPGELTAVYSCPDCGTGPELDHGRPGYWRAGEPAGLSVSLSRSRGWALLAAVHAVESGVRLGIDLECSSGVMFPGFDDVALTFAERERLTTLTPDQAACWRTSAWVRKEALLKSRGTGLRVDPATVEAFAEPGGDSVVVELDTVALGLPAGFAAALAVLGTAE